MASNQSKILDKTPAPILLETGAPNPPPRPPDHTQLSAVTNKPLAEMVPDTGQLKSADEIKTHPPSVASNGMQDMEAPHQAKESLKTEEIIQTQTDPTPTTETQQPATNAETKLSETTQPNQTSEVPQPISDTPKLPGLSENTNPISSGEEAPIVPKNNTKQLTELVRTEEIPLTTDNKPSVIETTDQVIVTSPNTSTTQPIPSVVEVSVTKESVLQTNHSPSDITDSQDPVSKSDTSAANIISLPISIPLMGAEGEIVLSDKPSEIQLAKKEQQLANPDAILQTEEMITDKPEHSPKLPLPAVPESAVVQEMEVTNETQPDLTSSSSDSLSRTDCSTQSSELMQTDVEESVVIKPVDKQQQQEEDVVIKPVDKQQQEIVVMDVTTQSPLQFTAPTTPDSHKPEKDSSNPKTESAIEANDEPMSPVCDSEVMQIDPVTVPLTTEETQTEVTPQLQPPSIDTIVVLDSPRPVPQEDNMEIIDLTSDTTPPCKRSKVSLANPIDSYLSTNGSLSKMVSDIQLLEQLINSCELLSNFSVQDQKISFSFLNKTVCIDCTLICLEDDYPQITLTVTSTQGEESDILSKRLPCVAWDFLKDCCTKQEILVPSFESLPTPLVELIRSSTAPLHTQISTQSTASQDYTGDDGDMDPSDDDDDEYTFDEIDEEVTMHSLLDKDIDRVKLKYGKDAVETRNYGGIGDIDIDLIIEMNFLEPEIARAWGVKHTVPLTFRLSLSAEHYLDGADIKVEVFQGDKGNTKGICKQIEKIVAQFISTSTKADKYPLCNAKVEDAVEAYLKLEHQLSEKRKAISKSGVPLPEKKGVLAQIMDKFTREKQVNCDMLVAQLVEMGWETELAVHALEECNMDLEKALDYLADEKTIESDEENNPKSYEKQHSRGAEVSELSWMSDISDTKEAALKSKMSPPLSHGFLCQVIQYILNRIHTLNDFCVICDDTHLFSNGAMLKPTVCARELCSFAFQTLGVMADVADSIATGPEVVELLVAMCNAASLSNRRDDILDPYPTVVDPTNPKQFSIHPKEKDFKKVEKAMGHVVQELKALPAVLKERLDSLNSNSFPLLQWVLASNRCHIVKLTQDRQIKSMGTTHQFLLLSAPPAKESAFRKLKVKHKSIYAFHGSRLENWHSILRNGLMNASGTKFQLHGAAYGSGIYLSPHASVSFGYSGIHGGQAPTAEKKKGRPTMLSSQNLNCIALCEVIDTSKIKKSGNIWVVSEPDHVVTRFFFVYEDNTSGDTNFDTREEKYIKEIENAVKSLIQS